jgi:hypothetical protein
MTYRAVRAAVLAVVATFIAAVVAPSPDAQASGSALGKAVRVAAHASKLTARVDDTLRIAGSIDRGRTGDRVQLQRRTAGRWQTQSSATLTAGRQFRFSFSALLGTNAYRVVRPATPGLGQGVSSTIKLQGVRRPVRVTAHQSAREVIAGDPVRFYGSVSAVVPGDRVRLQVQQGSQWRTVASASVSSRRAYSVSARPAAGSNRYRVVRPARGKYDEGTSPTLATVGYACQPLARPTRRLTPWSTNPTVSGTSAMATNLGRVFCSVAPGAKVRVAMFLLSSDDESELILSALERVHRYRSVQVEVLLERQPGPSPLSSALRSRLTRFAKLYTCQRSCHSDPSIGATMHQKFVTVDDMMWAAGKDPVAWSSSANWNRRQLRAYWQTGILVYGDRKLTTSFDARFESMRACATLAGDCGAWTASVWGKPFPSAYRPVRVGQV